ncbi:hypothetical protein [Kitasatospora camelliae]|uniref:Uncharacterized protein n=1 Tax=Kitasatospora camelliae TaxID=3156397 RepID=A0AAU8JVP0_9ACTN
MGVDREIEDDELLDVADNPAQAASLHKALRVLAANPSVGRELQEMAKDVLGGRVGMKELIESDRFLGAIGGRLSEMRDAAEHLSPAEREASEARARKMIEEREEEEEREKRRG